MLDFQELILLRTKVLEGMRRAELLEQFIVIDTAGNFGVVDDFSNIPIEGSLEIKEKSKLMPKAVEENWTIFFEHDPLNQACKVHFDGKHFRLKKSVIISE